MCQTLVTLAAIATSLHVFCNVHARMSALPRKPFLQDCVFSVRCMLRLKVGGNEVECSVWGRCSGQRNS
jgi:hypothetical protein